MAPKLCLPFCFVVFALMLVPENFAQQKEDKFEGAGHFSLLLDRDTEAE